MLCLAVFACIYGCRGNSEQPDRANLPNPMYTIDGLFDDWQKYRTGWEETGKEGRGDWGDDIDIKQLYYSNDDNYLYMFFRCKPSIEQRHAETKASGRFANLYIDSDSDKTTGVAETDSRGNVATQGADIEISIPIGTYVGFEVPAGAVECGFVTYSVRKWNPSSRSFDIEIREEMSMAPGSLIAHGSDGVEIALPLSDLNKARGEKFSFVCLETAHPEPEHANRIVIEIE